jgi:hypothetical protein
MAGYIMDNILSDEELDEARDLAASLDFYSVFQMYNIFHLDRADIPKEDTSGFTNTLMKYSKHDTGVGSYFLRYKEGSFTRLHHDNDTDLTVVTLLEDKDLVGGYSIVMGRYDERDRPAHLYCKRHDREDKNPPYGHEIIPDILPVKVGESLVYGPDLQHGVSKVYGGERLVLVSWYRNKQKVAT